MLLKDIFTLFFFLFYFNFNAKRLCFDYIVYIYLCFVADDVFSRKEAAAVKTGNEMVGELESHTELMDEKVRAGRHRLDFELERRFRRIHGSLIVKR